MKEEEDKLIKGFRNRLKDYSEPVSMDIWSSLEKELAPTHTIRSFSVRRIAVAAAILAIAISSVSIWLLNVSTEKYMQEIASTPTPVLNEPMVVQPEEFPVVLTPMKSASKIAKAKFQQRENNIVEKEELGTVETVSEAKEQRKESVTPIEKKEQKNDEQKVAKRSSFPNYDRSRTIALANKKDYKKWVVGVAYNNMAMVKSDAVPGFGTLNQSSNSDLLSLNVSDLIGDESCPSKVQSARAYQRIFYNSIRKDVKTDVKHKIPVTVGASFRYNLSSRFAIETGLTYTLLSSELKSGSDQDFYIEEYKLHYIGIPLKGNWMFLDSKYFSLYLSAGGAIEKSVSGKYKRTFTVEGQLDGEKKWDDNVKPVQWSLSAAVGSQYNATKYFGIYVEPGVIHYFDDGSDVQTIRKDKKTNFNLQLGLRWTY